MFKGGLGKPLTLVDGQQAARAAALNAIAQIGLLLEGDWARFSGLIRVDVYLACAEDFLQPIDAANAASEKFLEILQDRGRHARTLLLVDRLPMEAPIEIGVTFAVT